VNFFLGIILHEDHCSMQVMPASLSQRMLTHQGEVKIALTQWDELIEPSTP
jgi:hypothetical protein